MFNNTRNFLRKQFASQTTRPQLAFDITFGILAPLACLILDPFVYRNGPLWGPDLAALVFGVPQYTYANGRPGALGDFQVFYYVSIGLGIITLGVWLILDKKLGRWSGILASILGYGALFAFVTGIQLLPYSIFGLLFIIGLLGFTPFLTSFVFLRNAVRADHDAQAQNSRPWLTVSVIIGLVLILVIPFQLQLYLCGNLCR